eukprot:6142664-Amphidinium_carterae.3
MLENWCTSSDVAPSSTWSWATDEEPNAAKIPKVVCAVNADWIKTTIASGQQHSGICLRSFFGYFSKVLPSFIESS